MIKSPNTQRAFGASLERVSRAKIVFGLAPRYRPTDNFMASTLAFMVFTCTTQQSSTLLARITLKNVVAYRELECDERGGE